MDELHTIVGRLSRVSELVQCGSHVMGQDMQSMGVDDATRSYIMQQVRALGEDEDEAFKTSLITSMSTRMTIARQFSTDPFTKSKPLAMANGWVTSTWRPCAETNACTQTNKSRNMCAHKALAARNHAHARLQFQNGSRQRN